MSPQPVNISEACGPFFAFARARHRIYLARFIDKAPRFDWTDDELFKLYRFTNVFRELDRTTLWMREHVTNPRRSDPSVLLATVVYRWFNRIETCSAIFEKTVEGGGTAWDKFLRDFNVDHLRDAILRYVGREGPYVTSAYIIKTPEGYNKLDGVLENIRRFIAYCDGDPIRHGQLLLEKTRTLRDIWMWLRLADQIGDFMAYEIVSDLRWTALLENAPDIMTWANPGPGAQRGLNRIMQRGTDSRSSSSTFLPEMQTLLQLSRNPANWPADWPQWEMREVEHTLCEFDKYERLRLGEGKVKANFRDLRS